MSNDKACKIQQIIDLFTYDNNFNFWNIDTKITSIIDNFFINYINIPQRDRINSINIISENDKFKILCNNYSISPTKENDVFIARSTLRQYLEILEAFGIIESNENDKFNYLIISEDFLNVNLDFESANLINNIIKNFKQLPNKTKKVFFSIFISFLNDFSENTNDIFKIKTRRGKKEFTSKEISRIEKNCGYDFMKSGFLFLGRNLNDIFNNVLKMITKN